MATRLVQPQRADLLDKQALLDGLIIAALSRPEIHDVIERHTVTEAALRADAVDQGPTVFRTAEGEEQAWREAASPREGGIVKTVLAVAVFPTAQIAVLAWLVLSVAKVGGWPRLILLIGVALGALAIGSPFYGARTRRAIPQ